MQLAASRLHRRLSHIMTSVRDKTLHMPQSSTGSATQSSSGQGNPSRRRSFPALLGRARGVRDKDIESLEEELLPQEANRAQEALPIPGPVALLGVAFLWGTYSPALKLLYSMPGPPDPAALTAARGVIQAGSLWATSVWMGRQLPISQKSKERSGASALAAGVEMGFWNFLATSLQAIGLERTSAIRGAFIIQATSILTPLLAAVSGEWPSRNVWLGCILALGSTLLITLDSADPNHIAGATSLISVGDAAVLGAAFFYSVTTVRLGFYAQQLPAITLASAKSNALAAWALLWFGYLVAQHTLAGHPAVEFWEGVSQPLAWALVFWSALGPGALAAFLQSQGQSNVPSSRAQVYYGSTPIWSTLLAMLLIKGEGMGPLGWLGGAGVVIAGLLASR